MVLDPFELIGLATEHTGDISEDRFPEPRHGGHGGDDAVRYTGR